MKKKKLFASFRGNLIQFHFHTWFDKISHSFILVFLKRWHIFVELLLTAFIFTLRIQIIGWIFSENLSFVAPQCLSLITAAQQLLPSRAATRFRPVFERYTTWSSSMHLREDMRWQYHCANRWGGCWQKKYKTPVFCHEPKNMCLIKCLNRLWKTWRSPQATPTQM